MNRKRYLFRFKTDNINVQIFNCALNDDTS